MKKSEALEKLWIKIHCNGNFGKIMDSDLAEYISKLALETVEEFMLPPTYEGLMRDGRKFIQGVHNGYDTMIVRNRWEPEDDEVGPL